MAREIHTYTLAQVEQHVRDTLAVMEKCNVPDDVRGVAFANVLAMLGRKDVYRAEAEVTGGLLATALGEVR